MLRLPTDITNFEIPKTPFLDSFLNPLAGLEDWIIDNFFKLIDATLHFIVDVSFNGCLIVGMVALILYIFGLDDAKKWATLSPAIYILIKIIGRLIFGI